MQQTIYKHLDFNVIASNLKYAQNFGDMSSIVQPRKKIETPLKRVINDALPAACTIYVQDNKSQWTGSGFYIGNNLVVTAAHVAPQNLSRVEHAITLSFDGRKLIEAKVLLSEPNYDCAILQCNHIPDTVPAIQLGDSDTLSPGDEIAVIGSPEGWADIPSEGIVSGIHRGLGQLAPSQAWNDIIIITADILEGSSGGMVVGTDALVYGLVMGVTGRLAEYAQGQRSVCPSNKIRQLLNSL